MTLDHSRSNGVGRLVGTLAAILLFLSLNMFGSLVLTGVVEEKTTSVVEILLAHVRAHVLLAGKVLGIGLIALAQFSLLVVAGVVSLRISGTTVPGDVWVALPATIGWFVGGFAFYATLFALAGLVRLPPGGRPIVGRAGVVDLHRRLPRRLHRRRRPGFDGGDGAVDPSPFAPLLMPLRIATGVAPVWQVVLAAVLLVAAVWGVIRLAGAIYARSLLHRGSRITWRQALRLRSPRRSGHSGRSPVAGGWCRGRL